jgi:hypothetical protein
MFFFSPSLFTNLVRWQQELQQQATCFDKKATAVPPKQMARAATTVVWPAE